MNYPNIIEIGSANTNELFDTVACVVVFNSVIKPLDNVIAIIFFPFFLIMQSVLMLLLMREFSVLLEMIVEL